jgi:hypothetical protein
VSDSFESLLENALSAPDLELGHEMRRRLLAAAAPAAKTPPENVVSFEVPDPDAAAGFDWLVGDAPATRPLIRRMSLDPGFFTMLDDERRFLRSLRRSLRKPAAVAPKRRSHAVIAAAAAVLALAAGTLFAFRGTGSTISPSPLLRSRRPYPAQHRQARFSRRLLLLRWQPAMWRPQRSESRPPMIGSPSTATWLGRRLSSRVRKQVPTLGRPPGAK